MSKEATGQMGAIIGSSEYWSKINRSTLLGSLVGSPPAALYPHFQPKRTCKTGGGTV